ncbi:MAG: YbaK/EbsC family protein [Armatimonadetes bacterium]|nr:YbaK/EbsC family protein [Armatimonadota bacterium]
MNILEYLNEQGVDFTVKHHEESFTAQEEAAAQHVPGQIFAKTVVVKADDDFVMLVLPACCRVDMDSVEQLLGTDVRLATEPELATLFPDCPLGAEPPFGSRYGLRTYVDSQLADQETIAIRACSHSEVILLKYADFARLERPQVACFGTLET